jgi:hypothetical protein
MAVLNKRRRDACGDTEFWEYVTEDGETGTLESGVLRGPAVARVLPIDPEAGRFWLGDQQLAGADGAYVRRTAGGTMRDDDPKARAVAELREEFGFEADELIPVAVETHRAPDRADLRVHLYLAIGVTDAGPSEPGIQIHELPLAELDATIERYRWPVDRNQPGRDLSTLTLLLAAKDHLHERIPDDIRAHLRRTEVAELLTGELYDPRTSSMETLCARALARRAISFETWEATRAMWGHFWNNPMPPRTYEQLRSLLVPKHVVCSADHLADRVEAAHKAGHISPEEQLIVLAELAEKQQSADTTER